MGILGDMSLGEPGIEGSMFIAAESSTTRWWDASSEFFSRAICARNWATLRQ